MKYPLRHVSRCFFALLLVSPLTALGQTPFAGEDFDGGLIGGFTAVTQVFTPDLSGSATRGTFTTGSGSIFDRFGEVSRADNLPFGVVDDSPTIATDTSGFVAESKVDDFVLSVDVNNPTNPSGDVSAEWTFDISGRSNLELSIDMGMVGDFEGTDLYEFTYSIDGSPAALAFSVVGESGTFYSYTMDNGTPVDRATNGFFSETDWFDLVDLGPMGNINYHPDDTGLDGDTTAQDGFVPVTFADGVEEVRGNLDRTFDEVEFLPVKDPLVITSGDGTLSGEIIPSDFTTFTTALEGTGSTLTLTLNGNSDGGDEYFAFDNILLSEGEDSGTFGDFEPDGDVDIIDFGLFADAFDSVTGDANYDIRADSEPDGDVDIIDFGLFADAFSASGSASAIPEPTAAVLAVFAAVGLAARRNG